MFFLFFLDFAFGVGNGFSETDNLLSEPSPTSLAFLTDQSSLQYKNKKSAEEISKRQSDKKFSALIKAIDSFQAVIWDSRTKYEFATHFDNKNVTKDEMHKKFFDIFDRSEFEMSEENKTSYAIEATRVSYEEYRLNCPSKFHCICTIL